MCVLHVTGRNLDPTVGARLGAYRTFRIGEPRRPWRHDGPLWDTSGFSVDVSAQSCADLRNQVRDACDFLDRNAEVLRILRATGVVDDMRLDFPVSLRIKDNVVAQFEFFPPQLVEKAGALGLGLELSIYPAGSDQESPDEVTR